MKALETIDQQSAAVQKTPNRVTLESMLSKVKHEQYFHPETTPSMTICIVTMDNGFVVIGKAAPADPANFNEDLGREFARADAITQLWQLEGYALRERLYLAELDSSPIED